MPFIIKAIIATLTCITLLQTAKCQTWSEWFEQKKTQRKYLVEQIVKLQVYLGYLKKGYNIVRDGLTLIGDIKNGDFNLHQFFFNRLKQVNPKIKQYGKVADMITMQIQMAAAYKEHFKDIRKSGLFNEKEVEYLYEVFTTLLDKLVVDMDHLAIVLTDGSLEMHDNERIIRIDALHKTVSEKYNSFFSFIDKVSLQASHRRNELNDLNRLKQLYIP